MQHGDSIQGFVLHLERAASRRDNARHLAANLPVTCEVWAATDARELAPLQKDAFSSSALFEPAYPFALSDAEIAIFLSHRSIWHEVVARNLDAALILEDDVAVEPPEFERAFNLARAHVEHEGFIQFSWRPLPDKSTGIASEGGVRLMRPAVTPLGMQAQMVSRDACVALLSITEAFDRPVDTFLQCHWRSGLHLACVTPGGLHHGTEEFGGSTAQTKRPRSIRQKLAREWKRTRYRAAVKRFSEKDARP